MVGALVIVRVVDGLKGDDDRPRIAFKGGSILSFRHGLRTCASQDVDAAFRGNLDEAVEKLIERIDSTGSSEMGYAPIPNSLKGL
jgi:hypothetical protein